MPQSSVMFTDKSNTNFSLLEGWFSKWSPSSSQQNKSRRIPASTRGRDKRGDRNATVQKKPRAAEIRKLGRPKAKIVEKRIQSNASESIRGRKKKEGNLSVISEADGDEDDDWESVGSLQSSGSNYSALESIRKSRRRSTTKGDESSVESWSANATTATSGTDHQSQHQPDRKYWKENVIPLPHVMERPSIYSWFSASVDTESQAIVSKASFAGLGESSTTTTQSTTTTASENSFSGSSKSGSLPKLPGRSQPAKKKAEGRRKRSVGSDADGSKLKDFFDYFPWLTKLKDKKLSIDERLTGMDMDAADDDDEKEEKAEHSMRWKSKMMKFRGERDRERDSEWLHYSSSDSNFFKSKFRKAAKDRRLTMRVNSEGVSKDAAGEEAFKGDNVEKRNARLACEFIVILMPLIRVMQFMGRFPIEIATDFSKGTIDFRLNYRSPFYWAFYGTSILMALALVSLTIQVSILPRNFKDPSSSYQDILLLEFDKYWVELSLTGFHLLMLTASNLALLHGDGVSSLVDFLNRLIFSITLLQNDVTLGLKKFLMIVAILFCVYTATFTVLFFVGRNESVGIPSCRDSSGVIFLFMVDSMYIDLRLTGFYAVMEYIGLFIHLYVCLSTTLIITFILVFCIVLNNAATKLHVKLEETLCKEKEVSTKSELRKRRMTVIRKSSSELGNLFQEHLAINSLARQFGNVFTLTFTAFLLAKMFGIFISFYSLDLPSDNPHFTETFLDISSITYIDQEKVVPIRNQETEMSTVMKGAYFCVENVLIGWIVLEIAQKPGATLMESEHYVRKRGLIFCTNSKERRFISSMIYSFSPRVRYALHPAMNLNRDFIAKLWGFILIIAFNLLEFNHARTNMNVKMICDRVGVCTEVSHMGAMVNHAELAKSMSLEESINEYAHEHQIVKWTTKLTTTMPTTTAVRFPTTTTTTTKLTSTSTPTKLTTSTPTTLTTSTQRPTTTAAAKRTTPKLLIRLPCTNSTTLLDELELIEDCGSGVYLPYLFYKSPGGFKRQSPCRANLILYRPGSGRAYDCYENVLPWDKEKLPTKEPGNYVISDECLHYPSTLPKTIDDLTGVNSSLVLQAFYENGEVDLFCCYSYGGLRARNNPPCNLKSPDERKPKLKANKCSKAKLPIAGLRKTMELWLSKLKEPKYDFDDEWTNCVCQKDKTFCELVKKSLDDKKTV